jgi:hypothetical protein
MVQPRALINRGLPAANRLRLCQAAGRHLVEMQLLEVASVQRFHSLITAMRGS